MPIKSNLNLRHKLERKKTDYPVLKKIRLTKNKTRKRNFFKTIIEPWQILHSYNISFINSRRTSKTLQNRNFHFLLNDRIKLEII